MPRTRTKRQREDDREKQQRAGKCQLTGAYKLPFFYSTFNIRNKPFYNAHSSIEQIGRVINIMPEACR